MASGEGGRMLKGRRDVLLSLATLAGSQAVVLRVQAEDAATAVAGEEKVCNKALGCEIPKNLPPPKRVFKDIFEEERELAIQRMRLNYKGVLSSG